jgi:hypothetical protein
VSNYRQLLLGTRDEACSGSRTWNDWKAMTMAIPNNSSAKRITVQISTASGDAIEAWVYLPEAAARTPPW